jgi:hypothetical protein
MKAVPGDEVVILAADFAGIVPARRGAHCRPLHPRLASLCPVFPGAAGGFPAGPAGASCSRDGREGVAGNSS